MALDYEGQLFWLVEFQHVKPGKGGAFVRTRLKSVKTGAVIDRTFRAGERITEVRVLRREMHFLYQAGDLLFFMDNDTYDQMPLARDLIGDSIRFLKENMSVTVLSTDGGDIVGAELPLTAELKVKETDPGLRGDTASGGSKPAILETGAVVQVPLFINIGDVVKVDTRSGAYLERSSAG
jgi:elongation factor P